MNMRANELKPLGRKSYGSTPHMIGSRTGTADRTINEGQMRLCVENPGFGWVYVQEKLDGTNVAVAKVEGHIIPLGRAGYRSETSKWEQHHLFAEWVYERQHLFDGLLNEGERVCGEWLAQAHGTLYDADDPSFSPFVAFDIMRGEERDNMDTFLQRLMPYGGDMPTPALLCVAGGEGVPLDMALSELVRYGNGRHGALEVPEGVVYRVERVGKPIFVTKYVRPQKIDGLYLPNAGYVEEEVWNWHPRKKTFKNTGIKWTPMAVTEGVVKNFGT